MQQSGDSMWATRNKAERPCVSSPQGGASRKRVRCVRVDVGLQLEAPPVDDEEYREYRALSDIREPYRCSQPICNICNHTSFVKHHWVSFGKACCLLACPSSVNPS